MQLTNYGKNPPLLWRTLLTSEDEMVGKHLLSWMDEHERTPGYLCRRSGLSLEELIELITGNVPAELLLDCLAESTGIPRELLQPSSPEPAVGAPGPDPLRCLTVKEAAALLQVSEDTVRSEIDSGALGSVTIGQR